MFWYIDHSFRFFLIGLCRSYFYLSFCCYGYRYFFPFAIAVVLSLDGYLKRPSGNRLYSGSQIEAVLQTCSAKTVFLIISQKRQENTCARASFLRAATSLKKKLWHRYFSVNFVKFLRTSFLENTSGGCFWSKIRLSTVALRAPTRKNNRKVKMVLE